MGVSLSYSAAQKYILSARAYYLHYILRLRPIELSSALFFGNAVDIGLNDLLTQKMENKKIDINQSIQKFLLAWATAEIEGKIVYLSQPGAIKYSKADLDESLFTDEDKETIKKGTDASWLSLARKGTMMIEEYNELVLPKIQKVHFVQRNIKLENDQGDSFVGVIDFCATFDNGKTYIVDNKTTSIKYKDDSVKNSEQLATYVEAMKDEIEIHGAAYVTVSKKVRKFKKPRVQIELIFDEISDEFIEKTFQMYDKVLHGIKMGKFECNPAGCCSQPWPCSYQRYCASNGQDLTGLKFVEKSGK